MSGLSIFAGNSNPLLSDRISEYLAKPLGKLKVNRFSDGEIQVEILENVRKQEIYVLQSTCYPVNDHLVELLLLIDAFKRSSASRVTAVIPYFGYARQDKKVSPRVPISAKMVADLLENTGVDRVITMDLHAGQIQGFFSVPVDNLYAAPIIIDDIKTRYPENLVVVSPDAGGVERARAYAKRLHCSLAIVDKRRSAPNQARAMAIIGDVKDKVAIVIDDMVDTAGTLTEAAGVIREKGARQVHAYCTHPVLSGPAIERITQSSLNSLVATDTIPLSPEAQACEKIKTLSIAKLVGEAIMRSYRGDSVNSLFI
ncbi:MULTISPECIES: ribose-phosphate diphosphokinase [Desulfotignum]|jgi:ribose-phosphate pyrophosphokinase|uniref:Ribose-phosphate pyrophosphokinase n=1 Tax=Desulfotignum phosphitoxidans DSM 13687 TaxID=1286635 RepID=S0FY89_9BACT|nr:MULTISPECIES: ribose-phosphate pyrophosphokinase [Desulfotignum]EMS79665.1 ribose-phosphate pyrophosphokinase Prs [Desulfotignum phosphitoxidans DSM 13687]